MDVLLPAGYRQVSTPQTCDGMYPVADSQRLKDAGHVLFYRALRESKPGCDALI